MSGTGSTRRHWSHWLVLACILGIFVYLVLRAICVSVTHDEAYTFLHYVIRPIQYTLDVTYTNNHLLNSLFTRMSVAVFGDSELALRLPNLVFGLLYAVFAAKLFRSLSPKHWLPLAGIIGLTFNPFILDFFALSRGYGISLGLLVMALYYQYRSFSETRSIRFESLALLCTALACTANYTLINFFLLHLMAVIPEAVIKLRMIRSEKKIYIRQGILFVVLCVGISLFTRNAIAGILHLNELGNFNFGGTDGFWQTTVNSLVSSCCMYFAANNWWMFLTVSIPATLILAAAIGVSVGIIRKRNFTDANLLLVFLTYTISGCIAGLFAQHLFFKMPYPIDRTVIYFLPLFGILGYCLAAREGKTAIAFRAAMFAFFLPVVAAQCMTFNLTRTVLWFVDENLKQVTEQTIETAKSTGIASRPVLVAMNYEFLIPMSYYLYRSHTNIVQPMSSFESTWPGLADMVVDDAELPIIFDSTTFRPAQQSGRKTIYLRHDSAHNETTLLISEEDFEQNPAEQRKTLPGYQSASGDWLYRDQSFSKAIRDTLVEPYSAGTKYLISFMIKTDHLPLDARAVICFGRDSGNVVWKAWELTSFVTQCDTWQQVNIVGYADVPILVGDRLESYVFCDTENKTVIDNFRLTRLTK